MRWIGQHIWDFITRFRNEVYLEDISAGTPSAFISVDSSKKIVTGAIDASTVKKGVVELATTAETTTGTDTTKAVTPDGLKDGYQGSTNVTTLGNVGSGAWRATPVMTTYGGTNLSSYTEGDILYYSSGVTLSKLGIGTAGQVLKVNSGATAPEWGTDAAGLSFNGSTSNGILTYGSSTQADVESQLKFSGTELDIGSSDDHTASLQFTNDVNSLKVGVSNATNGGIIGTADGDVFINSSGDFNVCIGQNNQTNLKIDTDGDVVVSNNLDVTGTITGDVTGNASGSSGSCTGNAATATALATARAINGVDFDGTAPITITAAGSTLSDTVTVAKGGTGTTSLAADSILTGNDGNAIVAEAYLTYSTSDEELIIGNPDTGDATISRRDSSGTNATGGNLIIQAGPATGNAAGGSVKFYSSTAGGSGSAVQSSNEVASIDKDGNLQVDGGITTGSTSFVNSSGVVQVATQGTIDHDSLANFVANEHIDWTGASAGTIHSSNIPTLNQDTTGTAAGLSSTLSVSSGGTGATTLTSNALLTGNGTSAIQAEADLTFTSGTLTLTDSNTSKPIFQIKSTGGFAHIGGSLDFITDEGNAGASGDVLGRVRFIGDNADQDTPQQTYAQIQGKVDVATDGEESGILELQVANHDDDLETGLTLTGGSQNAEIDVTIGLGSSSLTTISGDLQVSGNDIKDDDGTTCITFDSSGNTTIAGTTSGTFSGNLTGDASGSSGSCTGQAATVATIAGLAPNTATTAAAQPNITSLHSSIAITKQVKVTLSTANCNALHTTPIELVAAQGANTVIVPTGGMIRVDRALTQSNSGSDINFHYEGKEPGTINQTALAHYRRFMYNESGDRVFHIIPAMPYSEVSQNLTDDVNKAVEISVDSAFTSNCFTSIDIYLTYNVFDIS